MDSWSFNSVGKGFANFASNESPSTFGKSELGSTTMGWEVKPTFIFGNNNMGLLQNEITVENQVFGDMGFPPLMKNSSFNSSYSQENEFNPATGSKSKESGKFDLKLGRVIDQNGSKISHNLSPSKRPREKDLGSTTPFCKVHGCNKDLSDCKDYHKRHKVCEVHSRTSKVIVNGIEQRFCQQCSRFHLLREFDDEKRSCRKRLAGHNERRRKPHGRLLPSYNMSAQGNEFKGSARAMPSFLVSNVPPGPYQHRFNNNARWETNLEDQTTHDLQSISTITTEQFHPKSFSPSHFKTNHRILNGCMGASTSSSESALSLLSSQTWGTTQDQYVHLHQQHDMNPIFGFEGSLVNLGIDHEISRGSKRVKSDDRVFQDDGSTIDLLQLSSQLERVEHQKQRSQVNLANGVSVGLSIT